MIADQEQEQQARVEFLQMAGSSNRRCRWRNRCRKSAFWPANAAVRRARLPGRPRWKRCLKPRWSSCSRPPASPSRNRRQTRRSSKAQADAQIAQQKMQSGCGASKLQQDGAIEGGEGAARKSAQELEARKLARGTEAHARGDDGGAGSNDQIPRGWSCWKPPFGRRPMPRRSRARCRISAQCKARCGIGQDVAATRPAACAIA